MKICYCQLAQFIDQMYTKKFHCKVGHRSIFVYEKSNMTYEHLHIKNWDAVIFFCILFSYFANNFTKMEKKYTNYPSKYFSMSPFF